MAHLDFVLLDYLTFAATLAKTPQRGIINPRLSRILSLRGGAFNARMRNGFFVLSGAGIGMNVAIPGLGGYCGIVMRGK